jgi:phage gp36-like protein
MYSTHMTAWLTLPTLPLACVFEMRLLTAHCCAVRAVAMQAVKQINGDCKRRYRRIIRPCINCTGCLNIASGDGDASVHRSQRCGVCWGDHCAVCGRDAHCVQSTTGAGIRSVLKCVFPKHGVCHVLTHVVCEEPTSRPEIFPSCTGCANGRQTHASDAHVMQALVLFMLGSCFACCKRMPKKTHVAARFLSAYIYIAIIVHLPECILIMY